MQVRGKIIKRHTRCRRLAEQILISWRKQQHHCFRKRYIKEKKKMQNLWLMRITVSEVLMMAKNISMVQTKTCPLIYFQTKQKKWRIEARWTIKVVSRIKLQIIGCFRKRQTWKQNKGEQKTLTNVVWDPRRNGWLKTVENDLKRLRKMMQQS